MSETRPTVFHCLATRGAPRLEAVLSYFAWPTRKGGCRVIRATRPCTSLLCHGFNFFWAEALKLAARGEVTHFLLQHDDVEVKTKGWVDLLVDEMDCVGAAVLSAVVAIKDERGETSTAVTTEKPWCPRKLTLRECWGLPETFRAEDCQFNLDGCGHSAELLVNTGVMLVDLRRPEFSEVRGGELQFRFDMQHRIAVRPDGKLVPQVIPEDWHFSRQSNARGLPVFATRKVECAHKGEADYGNQPGADVQGWFDFAELYRDAVASAPDGGTLVEVGVWKGKSLVYLLSQAKASGKKLDVVGVDHFKGSPGEPEMQAEAARSDIRAECYRNCDRAGYPSRIVVGESVQAARLFGDGSCDFVFLDAGHDCASVSADIRAWLPKVKSGGTLAGHDADECDVARAVAELLPGAARRGRCWIQKISESSLDNQPARPLE